MSQGTRRTKIVSNNNVGVLITKLERAKQILSSVIDNSRSMSFNVDFLEYDFKEDYFSYEIINCFKIYFNLVRNDWLLVFGNDKQEANTNIAGHDAIEKYFKEQL